MKKLVLAYLFLISNVLLLHAQISYGGEPLPLMQTKVTADIIFEEMHPFDVEEELRLDSINESDLRSGYRFAYKFITSFNQTNSGSIFYLPDGTKVWRLGIKSKGAYNINLLFSEYELPVGARLFVYNSDQSHILGSFNHLNNSEYDLLPIAPVQGDEIIIEYQEPRNVDFPGRLTVGEVNHAYRDFRGKEPENAQATQRCMPPVVCYDDGRAITADQARSVVLLIVDGTVGCSAALVNNTSNDGTPYLLTASHCLNGNFKIKNPDYVKMASTIISFFNYESPLCDTHIRGTEEMSMTSAHFRAVNEDYDMALVELLQIPPAYYRPYYSGWNAINQGVAPYYNIHHPAKAIKRMNTAEDDVRLSTFELDIAEFAENGHWFVSRWTEGSTAGGSSGSPLFDADGYIIGALSGGSSTCSRPNRDFFYALSQVWSSEPTRDRQLNHWLNPAGKTNLMCEGFDPYAEESILRLSNVKASGFSDFVEVTGVDDEAGEMNPVFGDLHIDSEGVEYAEEYTCVGEAQVYGSYFVTSAEGKSADIEIMVTVYEGETKPERLLHTETFRPRFAHYDEDLEEIVDSIKPLDRMQESYIHFESPVQVENKFYIGYRIQNAPADGYFAVANLPEDSNSNNTTWIKNDRQWKKATESAVAGFSTALFADPLINGISLTDNNNPDPLSFVRVTVGLDRLSLTVQLPEEIEKGTLNIFSVDGKRIRSERLEQNLNTISTSGIQPGIYIVKVEYNNKKHTQKVLL